LLNKLNLQFFVKIFYFFVVRIKNCFIFVSTNKDNTPHAMKTLEQAARQLLKNKIAFEYDGGQITVRGEFYFTYASYHTDTKKLVLMDRELNQIMPK
jgi:hypothetical protein